MATATDVKESKSKNKEEGFTKEQFDAAVRDAASKLIDERLADFKPQSNATPPQVVVQMHADIDEKEGVVVPPGYVPKDKSFTTTPMNNGTMVLTRLSLKAGFNPIERETVIEAIAEDFRQMMREVAGQDKPKPPASLEVNRRFRELFKHQANWADNTPILVAPDEDAKDESFKSVRDSTVRFKFVR